MYKGGGVANPPLFGEIEVGTECRPVYILPREETELQEPCQERVLPSIFYNCSVAFSLFQTFQTTDFGTLFRWINSLACE